VQVYLQELGEPEEMEGQAKEVAQRVFAILYATDNADFEAPAPVSQSVFSRLVSQSSDTRLPPTPPYPHLPASSLSLSR
jgi:hypothetical protein